MLPATSQVTNGHSNELLSHDLTQAPPTPDTQQRLSLTARTAPGPTPSSTLMTPVTRPAMWPPPSLPGPCSSSSQASTTTTTTMCSTTTTSPLSSPGQTSFLPANLTSTDLRPASILTSSLRFVRVWFNSHPCYNFSYYFRMLNKIPAKLNAPLQKLIIQRR